jgi:hypothetical protein
MSIEEPFVSRWLSVPSIRVSDLKIAALCGTWHEHSDTNSSLEMKDYNDDR